jgi:hypothetical protein
MVSEVSVLRIVLFLLLFLNNAVVICVFSLVTTVFLEWYHPSIPELPVLLCSKAFKLVSVAFTIKKVVHSIKLCVRCY